MYKVWSEINVYFDVENIHVEKVILQRFLKNLWPAPYT